MKLVSAILRPHRLDDVRAALTTFGVQGITLSQVTGFGFELWRTQTYRGSTFHDESVSNVRLELVVDDSDADDVVNVIRQAAMSTSSGTGKIWVLPVEGLTRIRTGERGADAL